MDGLQPSACFAKKKKINDLHNWGLQQQNVWYSTIEFNLKTIKQTLRELSFVKCIEENIIYKNDFL